MKTEVRRYGTTTAELLRLHEWLSHAGCTHVAMESTSVYWKPVFNLLEGSFEVVLANAYHIKAVPGRKTDVKDCEWIANLLAHGLIRASFIPPPPIRDMRDLTRHRKSLIRDRVKATNRVHKLLETANIKLANVVADVLGVSGRAMLDALVAGDTDPERLAKLAKGSLTPKVKPLAEARRGRFTSHHAFLLGQMLTQLDQLAALIAQCDVRILEVSKPFEPEIPRPRSKVVNKKKPKPHITPEEFARLVSLVDEPYATMMYVAVFTGLRVSELVGLKWEDVHEDAITVDERFCRGDWSVTKTAGSAATIGVAPSIIARIRRLKSMEVEINWGGKGAKKRFKLVRSNGPKDLVFQSLRSGAPISDGNVLRRHLRPAALKLGIDPKKATWRSLRTSCATWMIEAGRKPEGRARTDAARSHRHDDGHLRTTRVRKSAAGSDTYYGNGGNATGSAGAVARQDDQLSNNWNELERDCQK